MAGTQQSVEEYPTFVAETRLTAASSVVNSLEGIHAELLVDGATCWVRENISTYRWYDQSILPPNGVTIIQSVWTAVGRWILEATGGASSCDNVHIYTLWVSPVTGSDATGDGSECKPFKTISFALSQIPPLPAFPANYSAWANEKWVIGLGPGRYTIANEGPLITVRQVRRCISFQSGFGDGAIIEPDVQFLQDQATDWPTGPVPGVFDPSLLPEPWKSIDPPGNPLPTWELQGLGGGMQGGRTANNIIFLGLLKYHWASDGDFTTFCMWDRIQGVPGFQVTSVSSQSQAVTVELNDSSFRDGAPGSATEGVFGADGSGGPGGCTVVIKAQGSQIINRIGPFALLQQIQDCRLGSIDRDRDFAGVPGADGRIVSPDALNIPGLTNCAFEPTSVLNLGEPPNGGAIIACDGNTLGRMLALNATLTSGTFFKIVDVPTRTVRPIIGPSAPPVALSLTDQVVLATVGGLPGLTLTLPDPQRYKAVTMTVKKIDASAAGPVMVAPFAAELIDGALGPVAIAALNQAVEFYSDGTDWWIT